MNLNKKEFLEVSFLDYYSKISKKSIKDNDNTPINLIKTYFLYMDHMPFNKIADNYRRKYILNENKLESVHNHLEREGLRIVYDYILSDEWKNFSNIYVILNIHSKLYSKVPHPEFGGKFRTANAFIAESDIKTSDFSDISTHIAMLYPKYDDLLKDAKILIDNKDKQEDLLISYIDRAIELKCRLVEIHPFPDGNGRSCRALFNILLRNIGLPPIYVKNSEKDEYIDAMDLAIRKKDYSRIKRFYYYKICDSIYDLDISERKIEGVSLGETSKQYKEKISALKKLNTVFNKFSINFTLDEALAFLENDEKLNKELEKIFNDKLFRSDLKNINSTLLYTIINLYADKYNYNILEDSNKYLHSHISSALTMYYNDIQDFDLLSKNKENQLVEKYKKTNNNNIKTIIVNSYQKLIISICEIYANDQLEMEEFIQNANIILLSSIDSYNINSSYSFRTFISYQIRKYFDEKNKNKNKNKYKYNQSRKDFDTSTVVTQNALSIIHGFLDEEEYSVALKMFGLLKNTNQLSNKNIAIQLGKNEQEIEKVRKKVLEKITSETEKNNIE